MCKVLDQTSQSQKYWSKILLAISLLSLTCFIYYFYFQHLFMISVCLHCVCACGCEDAHVCVCGGPGLALGVSLRHVQKKDGLFNSMLFITIVRAS